MGVKWTPEQESAIMSPKDSNIRKKTSLWAGLFVVVSSFNIGKYCYS